MVCAFAFSMSSVEEEEEEGERKGDRSMWMGCQGMVVLVGECGCECKCRWVGRGGFGRSAKVWVVVALCFICAGRVVR